MARMGVWIRRFLGRPGDVDIGPYRRLVAEAGALADRAGRVTDLRSALASAPPATAEFCALMREAAHRALGLRPHDVQLIGALALLDGHVAEMATGEGKTLVGAIAAAGYALRGERVHVVSVNDYLARRDAEWMAPLYAAVGLTAGWIAATSSPGERREAYARDVTYAAVSELGFDVLRDRFVTDPADLVVPAPQVAIVDEADSVLVDEARVPLVLAGSAAPGTALPELAALARRLVRGYHFTIDDEGRSVHLTAKGIETVEKALGIDDLYADPAMVTQVNLALHAHALLKRDVDYIVRDGRVHLINPSRGRVAVLQRWPDGLHAAVEAKEGLPPSETGEILDSITVQGLLGRYRRLCGMTGTALAVGERLREFYGLRIAVIPPNRPCVRVDEPDRVYATAADKEEAIVAEIAAQHATGRPVLVGTLDIAESERLAARLRARGLDAVVLNAKNDAEEARIIAQAGRRGAITVSTQMAGRGTDIRLGGHDGAEEAEVTALGGLYVIGTGRHESSRLDDQLRGRAGRQGDPGGSVFFVSGEDHLLTAYAPGESLPPADEDGRVRHRGAAELIAHAQRVAEGVNLEIHRNTWRYTRVIERQRDQVLGYRDRVLHGDAAAVALREACPERYAELCAAFGAEAVGRAARQIVLYHLDRCWSEHLGFLSDLREGIHLRALGRLDPLEEFNREAVPAFRAMLAEVERRARRSFAEADLTADLADQGMRRPAATWTYLVQDNPFGSEWDRVLRHVAGRVRRRR
ncbi:MAG: accessory Sec system translocase SecA2 [Actinomycetales bacterium]|uniref:accessory Sec system translocase SecA2 n=1 Tax=Thermobispora bispora TaxID=2006 RepID=UPI00197FFE72|nr:accessory Sec system translocase SecA2 [Thermobispora bispora]MBO2473522.1 accessory Sec system translocase SecA2 [Actinomycetales bacterium]MDI9581629.1 accessory Sec system translocase SecA2 [Thermobispora sp.]QSI49054.1 accessory Sec system translocase SecA2 [Thermobispora bispora]